MTKLAMTPESTRCCFKSLHLWCPRPCLRQGSKKTLHRNFPPILAKASGRTRPMHLRNKSTPRAWPTWQQGGGGVGQKVVHFSIFADGMCCVWVGDAFWVS